MRLGSRTLLARAAARSSRGSAGFTLIELLVSMTAGLFVALAVFALAGATTKTFQDEARVAGTELTLRFAIERLRNDIARASYMSTGNIQVDPRLAENNAVSARTSGPVGIRGLAGVRLVRNGLAAGTVESGVNFSTLNGLSPDELFLAGNFTTADDFVVRAVVAGPCTRLWLVGDAPALWRVTVGGAGDAGALAAQASALRNAFQPVAGSPQFMARVVDETGRAQFLPTCAGPAAAGFVGTDPYVDVAGPLTTGADTGTVGGANGFGAGRLTVNPVQIVRWSISPGAAVSDAGASASAGDRARYNLVRQYYDVNRLPVGTAEIVAEYAVDLKIGFSVSATMTTDAGTTTALTILPIGDPENDNWAFDPQASPIANRGPQRIRSVRVRIAMRTALPDRSTNVAAPANYLYRYCLDPVGSLADCHQFARVRTVTTEIALPNQTGMFF